MTTPYRMAALLLMPEIIWYGASHVGPANARDRAASRCAGASRALGDLGMSGPAIARDKERRHGCAGAPRTLGAWGHIGASERAWKSGATAAPGRRERWGAWGHIGASERAWKSGATAAPGRRERWGAWGPYRGPHLGGPRTGGHEHARGRRDAQGEGGDGGAVRGCRQGARGAGQRQRARLQALRPAPRRDAGHLRVPGALRRSGRGRRAPRHRPLQGA